VECHFGRGDGLLEVQRLRSPCIRGRLFRGGPNFQEVAGAETIHGMNHLRVAGEIGSTAANLLQVTTSETKEFSIMYPRMIQDALAKKRQDAAESFALALERERHHQEVFARALELLQQKQERSPEALSATALEALATTPIPTVSAFSANLPNGEGISELELQTYIGGNGGRPGAVPCENLGRLREVVFGAQDGILSTVALVTSIAVSVGSNSTVLVAGLAADLAGMISMATGAYLGSRAQQDVRKSEITREVLELEERPQKE